MKHFFEWATKQKLALAAVCLMVLGVLAGGSLAAYNSQAYARGVAANTSVQTVRFSSNLLQNRASGAGPSTYPIKTVVFSGQPENEYYSFDVTVCNYANGNNKLINPNPITYTFKAEFSGDGEYKVNKGNVQIDTVSGSGKKTFTTESTLNASIAYTDTYTISFPAEELSSLSITITATPIANSMSATNNQILAAILSPGTGQITAAFRADGSFLEENSSDAPEAYDGFNYEASISSGKANATLTWPSYLEIDQYFLQKADIEKDENGKYKITENTDGSKTITFTMDADSGTETYLIPFYIADKTEIESKSWGDLKNDVKFSADQIIETRAAG